MTKKKDPKDLLKAGRPTLYNLELAKKICRAISVSTGSLQKICDANEGFPADRKSIYEWKFDHPEFSLMYADAKREQAELLAEEIQEIADSEYFDTIETDKGLIPNTAKIQRDRLRVDTRKWIACKLLPKVYGDKQEVTNNVNMHESSLKDLK